MGKDVNSELSTMAKAFPGNTESVPTFVEDDALFKTAFDIYKKGYPANEFTGLPVAEELMRQFGTEFQSALDGQESMGDASRRRRTNGRRSSDPTPNRDAAPPPLAVRHPAQRKPHLMTMRTLTPPDTELIVTGRPASRRTRQLRKAARHTSSSRRPSSFSSS